MPSKNIEVIRKYRNSAKGKQVHREAHLKYQRTAKRALTQQKLHLKKTYSVTLDEYKAMHDEQKGVCLICKQPEHKKMLSIDHSHVTEKIQGLLCQRCNTGIGMFKDNISILEEAIRYLKNY